MANKHCGNIGDVFKHLLLEDILAREQPKEYWESHAGAPSYPYQATAAQRHGIGFFFAHAHANPTLAESRYFQLLSQFQPEETLIRIPGSPLLALHSLGTTIRRYLFCDTDDVALLALAQTLQDAKVDRRETELVADDGLSILRAAAIRLPPAWAHDVLAFIDPFDAVSATASTLSPIQLWGELAAVGIKTALWYGYKASLESAVVKSHIRDAIHDRKLAPERLGHIHLSCPGVTDEIGLAGCGFIHANMNSRTIAAIPSLARELATLYAQTVPPLSVTFETC